MALDPPTPTLDAVTRACYARGLASETWLALPPSSPSSPRAPPHRQPLHRHSSQPTSLTAPAPAPPPLLDPTTPLPSALLPLLDTLVPLLLAAHPRRAPCTAAYLARVLRGAAQAAEREGEGEGEAERELLAERVRRARASLEGLDEAREVGAALSALEERL
ncbi:hypothetical protein JCM3775_003178, partial [Rhodotorula graminis]